MILVFAFLRVSTFPNLFKGGLYYFEVKNCIYSSDCKYKSTSELQSQAILSYVISINFFFQ